MKSLGLDATERLAKKYRLTLPRQEFAKSLKQALDAAQSIGYPVVVKLVSPDILHKTEAKGVITGVDDDADLERAFYALQKTAKSNRAAFSGVLVQEKVGGVEMIVGGKIDRQFGPVVLFGTGGILVEMINDISMRVIPITKHDAEGMLSEVKGRKIIEGVRGMKPIDKDILVDLILKVGRIMEREKVVEMDLNPVICNEKGCYCVDMRVMKE